MAAAHLAFLPVVRDFAELRVARARPGGRRRPGRRERTPASPLVASASIEAAVRGADVVCLCTSASSPVLLPSWLAPGAHLSSVGYAPPGGELDPALARAGPPARGDARTRSRRRRRAAPSWPGSIRRPRPSWGRSCSGSGPGRVSGDELTVYKSMGTVVEDLAAAEVVIAAALAR